MYTHSFPWHGVFPFGCFCLALPIGALLLAFWIWMLVDCIQNEPSEGNDKIIWILVIVLTGWIGALIYFFVRKQSRGK